MDAGFFLISFNYIVIIIIIIIIDIFDIIVDPGPTIFSTAGALAVVRV